MRWLSLGVCVPLFFLGFLALLKPRHYQETLVRLSARLPDQKAAGPAVRFLNGKYFIPLLRLWSLLTIGIAVAILRTIV
jgi:hypothetical protein